MNKAEIVVELTMHNAWSESDTEETGLSPKEGVSDYLGREGFSAALNNLAIRFGLELRNWKLKVEEQEES